MSEGQTQEASAASSFGVGPVAGEERRTKPPEVKCSQNSAAAYRASSMIDVSAPTSLSPLLPSLLWGLRTCVISSTWAGSAVLL